ncbi:MAG: tryptophan synthase subunit alpha, partial [Candidatus Hydrogenedentes bacterium]|nr:tryptophan synthase subunit alpha [Candidatus Hydrogenedentota bacterium]
AGADIIEFGIPFSDPIADGAVNQEAALRALTQGTTLHQVVDLVGSLRKTTQIPILLFTYYNPVLAYGVEPFAADCQRAGVDGVLCVDLPPGEDPDCKRALDEHGIATVPLIAPTSTLERIKLIARHATGFLYYVSRIGVTGVRNDIAQTTKSMVESIKQHSDLPVAVGFGISEPAHAAQVASFADGVIVGSAIVRLIGELGDTPDMPARVGAFVKPLVDATKARNAPQ